MVEQVEGEGGKGSEGEELQKRMVEVGVDSLVVAVFGIKPFLLFSFLLTRLWCHMAITRSNVS